MIKKSFSGILLTAFVFINAVNFNTPYCMENINQVNSIDMNEIDVLFSNALQQITDNKTQLTEYEKQILPYKQKLSNIVGNMEKSIEQLKSALNILGYHQLPAECKCIKEANESTNNEVNNIVKNNTETNKIVTLINDYNEQIKNIKSKINEQVKKIHDNLFGDDLSKFSIVLSQCTEKQLNTIYKILSISEVKDYIHNNSEIKNINTFLNEFNNGNNNNNTTMNKIIGIVRTCLLDKKSNMGESIEIFDNSIEIFDNI